ncbi:uncharacterized protein PG998_009767 [Apiospora kogelbergensis]|uniref:uncharacterized protein n=1 Tax=Apiospora kogelbergensis TaxID=1337665 RepID=UPI00312FF4ED
MAPHALADETGPATATGTAQQVSCALTQDLTLLGGGGPQPPVATPRFIYGTAWKGDRTADLVYQALKCGFRGIDTANQPGSYHEHLAGDGVRRAVAEGIVTRESLYLQTKFTYTADGPHHADRGPQEPAAPLEEQIQTSVARSLEDLATIPSSSSAAPYLDCLVLHTPFRTTEETMRYWRAIETYVPHQIRHLGIANAQSGIVEQILYDEAVRFPPSVVQNSFTRKTDFDTNLRHLCRQRGIVFQTFWTLTANARLVGSRLIEDVAICTGTSREVAFYALVLGLGARPSSTALRARCTCARTSRVSGRSNVGRTARGGTHGRLI